MKEILDELSTVNTVPVECSILDQHSGDLLWRIVKPEEPLRNCMQVNKAVRRIRKKYVKPLRFILTVPFFSQNFRSSNS